MADDDPLRYVLSEQIHEEIFRSEIVPRLATKPQAEPVALLLGGQTGAGKSRTKAALANALGLGDAAEFGSDKLRVHHPKFHELRRTDERRADFYTDHDARKWVDKAINYCAENRFNVILDSTLSRPASAEAIISQLRVANYRVEVAYMAVPAAMSKLGVLQRYQAQLEARGRGRVTLSHDASYAGVLDTADMIDHRRMADAMYVYRRGGGEPLYSNSLGRDHNWRHPPRTREIIQAERSRPWGGEELKQFIAAAKDLASRMEPKWHGEIAEAVRSAEPNLSGRAAAALRRTLGSDIRSVSPADLQPPRVAPAPRREPDRELGE